jgi:hypothetical protein
MFRCVGQAGSGALMSNVRPHKEPGLGERSASSGWLQTQTRSCTWKSWCAPGRAIRPASPSQKSKCTVTARCPRFLVWLGWRRPPVRWRAAHQTLLAVELFKQVARSLRSRTTATSGTRMNTGPALVHHLVQAGFAATIEPQCKVRPNPSFEPTRSGMALGPRGSVVHHPPRGPSTTPPRSAQLKR